MAYRNRNSSSSSQNMLSDRDMLFDLLSCNKHMSMFYDTAVMESNSSMMRDTFESMQQDEHKMAEEIYGMMQQEGWYSPSGSRQQNMQTSRRYSGSYRSGSDMSPQDRSFSPGRSRPKIGSNTYVD